MDHIPKDIYEAVDILMNERNTQLMGLWAGLEDKSDLPKHIHHGHGTNIRNRWGLWRKDTPLCTWFRNELGIWHADDMSGLIHSMFTARLENKEFDLKKEVKVYHDYWKKYNIHTVGDADNQAGKR